MNNYTKITQQWLDNRFKKTDSGGFYIAHQPIYGYKKGPNEPSVITHMSRTYQIIKEINKLSFTSFLDVGGAEGYYSNIIKRLFNIPVITSDLSVEACTRAKELYNIQGVACDAHNLPFRDNAFDLVLCSETLEHVKNYEKVISELIRVTNKYLIVTVPNENISSHLSKSAKDKVEPHGHINAFTEEKIKNSLKGNLYIKTIRSKLTIPFMVFVEGPELPQTVVKNHSRLIVGMYNLIRRGVSRYFGIGTVRRLVKIDDYISKIITKYNSDIFCLYKKRKGESNFGTNDKRIYNFITKYNKIEKVALEEMIKAEHIFDKDILTYLKCVNCNSALAISKNKILCSGCGKLYEIQGGVPIIHV